MGIIISSQTPTDPEAQRCETSSCWPGQSPGLPSPDQHVATRPSKDGSTPLLCSEPREGLDTALLRAMGRQLSHDSRPSGFCPVSSCISRISQDRAVRSRCQVNLSCCQERVLFPPPSNRSCVVCASSIYLNLLHLDPSQTPGRRTTLKSSTHWKRYQQYEILPPHPGVSSHQHHLLTCFSSPSKRKTWQKSTLLSDQKVRQTLNQKETKLWR